MAVPLTTNPYVYNAVVVAVHDGDTISLDVDLGFGMWIRPPSWVIRSPDAQMGMWLRLLGCNARELNMPGGIEARDNLRSVLPTGLAVVIQTVRRDKFGGRYDASVLLPSGEDLVGKLIAEQWAARWDGTGPKLIPPWPRTVTP